MTTTESDFDAAAWAARAVASSDAHYAAEVAAIRSAPVIPTEDDAHETRFTRTDASDWWGR